MMELTLVKVAAYYLIVTMTGTGHVIYTNPKAFESYDECVVVRDQVYQELIQYNRNPDRKTVKGISSCREVLVDMDVEYEVQQPFCEPQQAPRREVAPKRDRMPFRSGVIG